MLRLRDVAVEKRRAGMDKKQFATFASSLSSDRTLEKTLLFRVWAMLEDEGEAPGKEEEERHVNDQLARIRQEVIAIIVKNCSKRPLFEKARILAGNITYKTYIDMYKLSRNVAKHLDE